MSNFSGTYTYQPYPLNPQYIRFYPSTSEPQFADGIPNEPEFNIQPAPEAEAGEPGAFYFQLKLKWDSLLETNEPLFKDNEDNNFKVCEYAVSVFEEPKQLCRRITWYNATNPSLTKKGLSLIPPQMISDLIVYQKDTLPGLTGQEPGNPIFEPTTDEGLAFLNWLKINEFKPPPQPAGQQYASIFPGKPACTIIEPGGNYEPTGYSFPEEYKYLEPTAYQTDTLFGWFPCNGAEFPLESQLPSDGKTYLTSGELIAGNNPHICYDCGVCFKPTHINNLKTRNVTRRTPENYADYELEGYQPAIRKGFPQPFGEPSTDQRIPQPEPQNQCSEPGNPSVGRGQCLYGNWGPNGAEEPDYGYNPPYPNYSEPPLKFNCNPCQDAMERNTPYGGQNRLVPGGDGDFYENYFYVQALNGNQFNTTYKFQSATTFSFNYEPSSGYKANDSCYARLNRFSCLPGNDYELARREPEYEYCVHNSHDPSNCLSIYLGDCIVGDPPAAYIGKASPLKINVLDNDIYKGRSGRKYVIINDWYDNQYRVDYNFIISQVCGKECSYIPLNGARQSALYEPNKCDNREPSNILEELNSPQFKALSNKKYLGIVTQIWNGSQINLDNIIEEELNEKILIVEETDVNASQVSITQFCEAEGFTRRPPTPPGPPEPPPRPPPTPPGAGGGPGNIFKLEGLCQDKFAYNCEYVRYRPELSMNYQPIAGHPLPYKYIDTMGSSLAKKRQNANLIINASAHRKNTVHFITRNPNCGEYDQCNPPPKCPQCTGNPNPNNNRI